MNFNSTFTNPSLKGRREDLNNIKTLSENNMPILPNKRQLILSAIDNIGKDADKKDIEMLMGTVETMKYGIKNNSEFAKTLGGTSGEKENTDWDGILQNTIKNAIEASGEEDKSELEARFQKIFGEEKPLSEEEKKMLDLRQSILSSKEMTNVLSDSEKTLEAARVTQNLDYFIASSEINNQDKLKCLELMNHFLSDDYEIHPQLKNYKVQAFSEMVNDLIIKRPDEEAYTIKDVSQKQTGMCAAISIARKTIAYEDKVRAMEIMMAELDNKPVMEVYDRTELGSGKKVLIEKAHVDFTDGIKKGYRIIDTGTHQWMNAANVVGDGSISTAHYQAFDPDNYEIFRDAKWMNDLPDEYKPAQNWLRYLNKEEEAISTAARRNADIAKVQREIGEYKKDYELEIVKSDAKIRTIIKEIDPSISDLKATTLTRQLLKADKMENKDFKLVDDEPKSEKMKKLSAFIKSELPNVSSDAVNENIERISMLRDLSVNASKSLDKLKSHQTPQAIFSYNKNLFMAAAHHRRSVQAELDVPERLLAYEKTLNIPVRENLVQDSVSKILNNLSSETVVNKTAKNFGVDANADAVKLAVNEAITMSEVSIPAKLDNILSKMGMGDRINVVTKFLNDAENKIKSGDIEVLQSYAENAHVKQDKNLVLKKIETIKNTLANNPSNKDIAEAVSVLGYNNQIEMTADMYKTFTKAVDDGSVSKEQLTSMFGSNVDKKVASLGKEIKSAADKQAQIERQLNLPSRKDVVLSVLEATGEVLPEKTLQQMQEKFDKVAEVKSENDNRIVDPGVKRPKVPTSIYKFTPAESELYSQIEAKLPSMKKYAKVNYKAMNEALTPQLDALFAEAGRLDGRLWVSQEGSSGLFDNQSIKLLEMITDKHYYNEQDIDKVVNHIKKGEGSGTSSTNVDSDAYSGHAQYVAEVSQVAVIDPETKEVVMKDVLWHDNTWGRAEDKNVWIDEKGVERTNYGKVNRGGPEGYVFNKHLLTGTFVEDQKYTPGILKNGEKFDLWRSTRIKGENPEAYEKTNEVMEKILELGNAEEKVAEFENKLKKSAPVNFTLIDNMNQSMAKSEKYMLDKIEKGNFNTQKDIDNIKDSTMKFLLNKTAMQMSVSSKTLQGYIQNIVDENSLTELQTKLPDVQKELIGASFLKGNSAPQQVIQSAQKDISLAFGKLLTEQNSENNNNLKKVLAQVVKVPLDKLDGSVSTLKKVMIDNANEKITAGIENKEAAAKLSSEISDIISRTIDDKLSINSVDKLNEISDIPEVIIAYVDKKFNTSSDADLLSALQKIQNMTNEEFNEFMADAQPSDLGIKNVDALSVAKQINAQKAVATDAFSRNSRIQVIFTEGPKSNDAVEWDYRKLTMDLNPISNTIQINKMKKQVFEKQGIRAAFPEASVMSQDEIKNNVKEALTLIKDSVSDINNSENKGKSAAKMNAEIQDWVAANIAEKYQSKAVGLLNSYVKALRNNSVNTDKVYNDAATLLEQAHITKYPDDLLKAFIKEVQSENTNVDKLSKLREYLTKAVKTADIANVEYDLISNAGDAIETMTKSAFSNYTLQSSDGNSIALDSDDGILYLVSQLANPENGSTALQVFFAHTGLSERAVDLISSSMDLKSIPAACDEISSEFKQSFAGIKNLNEKFKEFTSENSVKYSSYKDALTHFIKTMDKEAENMTAQEKNVYSVYKSVMKKTKNAEFLKNLPQEQVLSTLSELHEKAVSLVNANIWEGVNEIVDLQETISSRLSAMQALKLASNSDKEIVRQQFVNESSEVYNKITNVLAGIYDIM